ncbi:glycosyltransferase family 2 protein [Roseinatronobacter alkalisoli]|uniref:Glycosyltransferase n=1 Tax=Roseinatronobacter alkalisoli TaxID=3028235 RepID=A0ABT5TA45_9RHOB|nr:glycosyltransferase [Roseinatronobacter sp. HJB301]MDD7971981.1 glycosyltransferase [Roseinatronobacter sp. HJB301]
MTETMPTVSVVCAWYNRADYIRDTIDSLLAQDYPNFDITVVNDGSPDPRVREILDSYTDPRLRVIHQDNTGFTRAIRRAIVESDGTYIAIQGAGDISLPGRLSAQVRYLEDRPDFAVVGCRYVNQVKGPDGDGERKLARVRTLEPTARDIMRGNPFGHGEVTMRRAAYDAVGGYRVFFENSQDKDLWMRMSVNYRLGIIDETHYQRVIFLADGIASSFEKTLKQIAYSRVADVCHQERLKGERDSVDRFGQLALMRVPKGWRTTWRIVRAVKQVASQRLLAFEDFKITQELFGTFAVIPNLLFYVVYRKVYGVR